MEIITFIIGITFTIVNYGANFGSNEFLTNIFTNIYICKLWYIHILYIISQLIILIKKIDK